MTKPGLRFACGIGSGILVVILGLVVSFDLAWTGSPARMSGVLDLPGLIHPVRIDRDRLDTPTVVARDADDAYEALGFLQAQDRFFEMDLLRRAAAGKLSALFGPATLATDRRVAPFDLSAVARAAYAAAPRTERRRLRAFTRGVNAGLRDLPHRPLAYALLGVRPRPWRPWDSYLVIGAMYLELQDPDDRRAENLAVLRKLFPQALYRFLAAPGNRWDAPLEGPPFKLPPLPGPSVFDLRKIARGHFAKGEEGKGRPGAGQRLAGSNGFAVSGRFTRSGAALLANDMHLHLALPTIWYRAEIRFRTRGGQKVHLLGATLPGVPALVVGTNFHVAWGFTNTEGDWVDLIRLVTLPGSPLRYETPEGPRRIRIVKRWIRVRGEKPVPIVVRRTIWGPVIGRTPGGTLLVSRWVGEDPSGYRINAERALETSRTVIQAIRAANRLGIPEQNFVVADRSGNIGWSVAGVIPRRVGHCTNPLPQSWAKGQCRWAGVLSPHDYPRIVNPPDGFIWTANQRIVGGEPLRLIGDGGYDLGARARQIRNDLFALKPPITARDLLAIELDDRAIFLGHWRRLLLERLTPDRLRGHPRRIALAKAVRNWQACACTGSVGYDLVWTFRKIVKQRVLAPFLQLAKKSDPHFKNPLGAMVEGPVWAIVTKRPAWLLAPRYPNWPAFFHHAIDRLIRLRWHAGSGFRKDTWGRLNRIVIANPLARGIPLIGPWLLDLPPTEIPGDSNMPRVQTHFLGASERMVVDLAHPARSLFELPGGESGNPASPFYTDEFPAWLEGLPEPFAPGPPRSVLLLWPEPKGQEAHPAARPMDRRGGFFG
jgi:penicillin amidase